MAEQGQNNNQNGNQQQYIQQQKNVNVVCDNEGSSSSSTRADIQNAIVSVLSGGQATNPESISVALRKAGYLALLFSGGHGFYWNFECEWSDWSWDGESYRFIVWRK